MLRVDCISFPQFFSNLEDTLLSNTMNEIKQLFHSFLRLVTCDSQTQRFDPPTRSTRNGVETRSVMPSGVKTTLKQEENNSRLPFQRVNFVSKGGNQDFSKTSSLSSFHPAVSYSFSALKPPFLHSTSSPQHNDFSSNWRKQRRLHFNVFSGKFMVWFLMFQQIALSSVVALRSSEICKQIRGLTPQQRSMCQAQPNAIVYVSEGAQIAMAECRWQFRNNRWNCTTKGNQTVFGSELRLASKEKAFDYAIKSAGVLYAIVTACGRGLLRDCGCASKRGYYRTRRTTKRVPQNQIVERDRAKAWRWGGCSVDIGYGLNFTREFMDAREIRQNDRSLMNIHNNEAGRIAITRNLKKACRCHGVSGSCTMRTCWITLPSFREVGNILKRRYEAAKNVVAMRGGSRGRPQFLKLRNQKRNVFTKPAFRDLVFLDHSPSFCEKNDRIGIFGTRGRQCNVTARGERNCASMCCNRGYRTIEYVKKESCRCKFFWCCTVQCEVCLKNATNHTCN